MHRRAPLAVAVSALLTVGSVFALTGSAQADPTSPLRLKDIAGVGSDTTQYVMDGVATAYNASSKNLKVGSWDAVPPANGSTTIVTKQTCAPITRPNGGSAGIAALQADTQGCIDFARTISPKATDGSQNALTFFAYGRDGVAWATVPSKPTKTPTNLTTAQLASIYTCQVTNWKSLVPGLPSNAIHAKLPQVGSALRKTFLTRLGLSDSTVGSCVDQTVQQNEGTDLNNDPLAIVPHSIASYVAQSTGKVPDVRGGVVLRKVNGKAPLTANGRLNASTYDQNYLFLIYNVVKSPVAPKYTAIFGAGKFICTHGSVITAYGFATIGSACGTTS